MNHWVKTQSQFIFAFCYNTTDLNKEVARKIACLRRRFGAEEISSKAQTIETDGKKFEANNS
jgi:hypothetical protein